MVTEFTIVRDTREQNGYDFEPYQASTTRCLGTIDKKLDTGDYSILGMEDLICIERKASVSEISTNLGKEIKRFERELERMSAFKHKYLLLEFSLSDVLRFPEGSGIPKSKLKFVRITPQYLVRQLTDIQVKYGVHVLFCGNRENAQLLLSSILRGIIRCHPETHS